jgi:hypothetical protein
MASTGEEFIGTRKIFNWYDDLKKDLPESLVKKSEDGDDSYLTISVDYSLKWHDINGDLCTVTSLQYMDGGLSGGKEITIEKRKQAIPLPEGARVEFATDNDELYVRLVGGFVDGEPGTIVLEAHPRSGEERRAHRRSRGWRRWLRRLIHRLDELLAEA